MVIQEYEILLLQDVTVILQVMVVPPKTQDRIKLLLICTGIDIKDSQRHLALESLH